MQCILRLQSTYKMGIVTSRIRKRLFKHIPQCTYNISLPTLLLERQRDVSINVIDSISRQVYQQRLAHQQRQKSWQQQRHTLNSLPPSAPHMDDESCSSGSDDEYAIDSVRKSSGNGGSVGSSIDKERVSLSNTLASKTTCDDTSKQSPSKEHKPDIDKGIDSDSGHQELCYEQNFDASVRIDCTDHYVSGSCLCGLLPPSSCLSRKFGCYNHKRQSALGIAEDKIYGREHTRAFPVFCKCMVCDRCVLRSGSVNAHDIDTKSKGEYKEAQCIKKAHSHTGGGDDDDDAIALTDRLKQVSRSLEQTYIPIVVCSPHGIVDINASQQYRSNDWKHTPAIFLFSHGNAADIGHIAPIMERYAKITGCTFVAYDYTGYGMNRGEPNESNCVEDLRQCYTWLVRRQSIPSEKIVLMGHSLGSGPSIAIASEYSSIPELRPAGLIVVCGFSSCLSIVSPLAASLMSCCDVFVNVSAINKVTIPTLIVHGARDGVISPLHSRALFDALPGTAWEKLEIVPRETHNSTPDFLIESGMLIHYLVDASIVEPDSIVCQAVTDAHSITYIRKEKKEKEKKKVASDDSSTISLAEQ